MTFVKLYGLRFRVRTSDPFRFGKTFLVRVIEKQQSELLLNLKIFYLSHAVCKILQFLMMERDVKSGLTVIAKECLLKVHMLNFSISLVLRKVKWVVMLLIKAKYEHMLVDPQIGKYLNTV